MSLVSLWSERWWWGCRFAGGDGEVPRVCSALSPRPDASPALLRSLLAPWVPGLWSFALVLVWGIQAAVTVSKVPRTLMVTGTDAASRRCCAARQKMQPAAGNGDEMPTDSSTFGALLG